MASAAGAMGIVISSSSSAAVGVKKQAFTYFLHLKIIKPPPPLSLFPSLVSFSSPESLSSKHTNNLKPCVFLSNNSSPSSTVGDVISRFEKKGFKLRGLKLVRCSKELAKEHYKDLQKKPFFQELVDYLSSGPVVSMAWEGDGVIASARMMIGSTNPLEAAPGTIRGDLAILTSSNVIHGSDSPENSKREIDLWFKEEELLKGTATTYNCL